VSKHKMNPKSLANLKPAQPGEVKNQKGINRKRPYSDRHGEWAEKRYPERQRLKFNKRCGGDVMLLPGATWADVEVGQQRYEASVRGSTRAIREISDRIEGKPPQRFEISVPVKQETTITVKWDKMPKPASAVDGPVE